MTTSTYLRARSAEQKEERRRHLLNTAKALLHEVPDVHDMGINELARCAQMTKSNVYRYFESSEAVLLTVLAEEFMMWRTELRTVLEQGATERGTIEHIAQAFSATLIARPLMCRLISVFPSILELNISMDRMIEFKLGLQSVRKETALDFHRCMPSVSHETFEKFIHQALPFLIGLWPLSHPGKISAEVMARPNLADLHYDFQEELEEGLLMLLRSRIPGK